VTPKLTSANVQTARDKKSEALRVRELKKKIKRKELTIGDMIT